ncbi:hypothetical protein D9M71_490940 [compost metagenome]
MVGRQPWFIVMETRHGLLPSLAAPRRLSMFEGLFDAVFVQNTGTGLKETENEM